MYQIHQESTDQNDPVSSVSIHLSNSSMLQFTLPSSMKNVVYYGGNVLANASDNNLTADYNDLVMINSDTNLNQNIDNAMVVPYSSHAIVLAPAAESVVCNKPIKVTKVSNPKLIMSKSGSEFQSNIVHKTVSNHNDLEGLNSGHNTGNIAMGSYQPKSSSGNTVVTPVPDSVVCTVMPEDRTNTKHVYNSKVSPGSIGSNYTSEAVKLGANAMSETMENLSSPNLPDISSINVDLTPTSKEVLCSVMSEGKKKTIQFSNSRVSAQRVISKSVSDLGSNAHNSGANGNASVVINAGPNQITGNVGYEPSTSPETKVSTPVQIVVTNVMPGNKRNAKKAKKSKVGSRSITSKSVPVVSKLGDLNCDTSLNQNMGNVTLVSYPPNRSPEKIILPGASKPVICTIMHEDKINAKRRFTKPRFSSRRSVHTSEFLSSAQTRDNQENRAIKPVVNDEFMDLDNDTGHSQNTGNLTISYPTKSSLLENNVLAPVSRKVSCSVMTKQDATQKNGSLESLCDMSRIKDNLQPNTVESRVIYDDLMDLESETNLDRNVGNVTSISYPQDSSLLDNTVLAPASIPIVSTVIPQEIKNSKQVNKLKVSSQRILTPESASCIPKDRGWQDCSSEEEEENVQIISDKPVICRAVASLPASFLYFGRGTRKPLAEGCNGVFAKKEIPRKAQFGPLEGVFHSKSSSSEQHLELSIFNNGVLEKLDISNENASNWMRYVRCAKTSSEQNLSLYQIGQKLYFRAVRRIAPDEELKVWYSLTYARDRKLRLLCPKNKKVSTPAVNSLEKENVSVPEKETQLDEEVSEWRCWHCFKVFKSATTFNLHLLTHAADNIETNDTFSNDNDSFSSSLMETDTDFDKDVKAKSVCFICKKAFLTNPALACHLKSHAKVKNFDCPICNEVFNKLFYLRQHIKTHSIDGSFFCPHCSKKYKEYTQIRNHIRRFHCEKNFGCVECSKLFSTVDKLKLHMLSHSEHREFSCEICGKQFKRKDKLGVHMKRAHLPVENKLQSTETAIQNPPVTESLEHDVATVENNSSLQKDGKGADYTEFIYKCHICSVGFKRRGMLVNHLANRHPDVTPDSVPELNLPILKAHRDYYCQYCDKIYKSSSKRKAHILKNHPGEKLPLSNRQIASSKEGIENGTYSLTVGSLTTNPQNCDWCHKQYASKAKLLQHQRKHHCNQLPKSLQRPKKSAANSSEEDSDTIRDAVLRVIETDLFLPESLDMSEYETSAGESRFFSGGEFIIDANTLKRAIRGEVLTADCSPETIYELGQIIDARPDGYFKVYQAHSGITLAHPVEVWDPTQLSLSTSPENAAILQPSS